ncbi:MAG: hypothetical protein MJB57_16925 [Gemmatimonadetes bacterium]|nr:hypothetical protein [Gemmatimonadota bacterium]
MTKKLRRAAIGLGLVLGPAACGTPTGPDGGSDVSITLAASGGFAGVDWQVTVRGLDGRIVGERCRARIACDWLPGQELATFEADDLDGLTRAFTRRGFFEGPADFGRQCCDQLDYTLRYAENDFDRVVTGSEASLSSDIRSLILAVRRFVDEHRARRLQIPPARRAAAPTVQVERTRGSPS